MFEFQANKNDSQQLMRVLERFTRWWFFAPHGEDTGVSPERLQQVNIPTPLKRLYSFAGEWPGGTWESIFSHQDHLAPFEFLQEKNGKLVFGWENQGAWLMATELSGEDPPVFIAVDDGPFQPFCESLSQFLVTFCLHESVFGAPSLSPVEDLGSTNNANGKIPIPLWLDAPYPSASNERYIVSFYLVDGCVLQMAPWCGGSQPSMDERYPYFFPKNATHRPDPNQARRHLWEIPEVPKFIKRNHVEMLIQRHVNVAASHLQKAEQYKTVLANVEKEAN